MTTGAARGSTLRLLLLFVCLAVAHTWPLASHPSQLSRNDNADTVLNEWALAWVAHQAPRHPLHLFDANIFHPERRTLAYSEHLLVPALMGAPLAWAGASPVLVYNLLLMAGFALTGWTACLLVRHWTGDSAAGIVCGTVAAFNAHTLTRLPHVQALHVEFLFPALLALDALLAAPSARRAVALAGWFTLQALTSFYLLVFTAVALGVGGLARPEDWWGPRARRVAPFLALAAGVAVVLVAPFLWPYWQLGVVRSLDEVGRYSAAWQDYLATPARLHYPTWSARFFGGTALFPGVAPLVLALGAVASGEAWRNRRARMALAFGVVGVALSFGPALPGYAALYRWLPLLQGIRGAARFGYLGIVAVAILAGVALAAIRRRWADTRWVPALTLVVILLVNADALVAPVTYSAPPPRVSPVYASLRSEPGAVVVEIPFYPPDRILHNAQYMLNATAHWRPMLNGYSGFVPPSYEAHYRGLRGFPDDRSLDLLTGVGVTHVVVHYDDTRRWLSPDALVAARRTPRLHLIAEDGDVGLYRLR